MNGNVHSRLGWIVHHRDMQYYLAHHLFNRRKDEYKQCRAYLRKQIREAKRKYYDHIFSLYKNDIKNTWKILNETLNRNRRKHQSQDFLINNELVNDPDIIVNEFNAYFVNIAKKPG